MNNGILLLGPPGVGKTYWGKKLAKHLGIPFFDLDELVMKETQLSIHEIFEEGGEPLFRKIETSILMELFHNQIDEKYVLSLGGGTPAFNNNMEIISRMGVSVYLSLPIEKIIMFLKNDTESHRPLVKNADGFTLKTYLQNLIEERKPFYHMADYMLLENELSIANFIKIIKDNKL